MAKRSKSTKPVTKTAKNKKITKKTAPPIKKKTTAPKKTTKKPAKKTAPKPKRSTKIQAKTAPKSKTPSKEITTAKNAPTKVTKKIAKPKKPAPTKKAEPKKKPEKQVKAKSPTIVKPDPKPAAKPLGPKESKPRGIYSADQWKKYNEIKKELQQKNNNELKEMLKKNNQSRTGNKDDLIAKICDGKVLGQIPRCPKCFGGRPKMNINNGKYYCVGYRDDVDFVNCHKTFDFDELKREDWVD